MVSFDFASRHNRLAKSNEWERHSK